MARGEWRTVQVAATGSDGWPYTVVARALYTAARASGDDSRMRARGGTLKTSDGHALAYLGVGHYCIGLSDIELRSTDPNAP